MAIRFPPIAALRALEAAARHLNYTRAAEELHITQSAVSHQIRHAETLWELKLFDRRGRRLMLTEAGHALVPIVRDFIRRISSTLEEFQDKSSPTTLKITSLQSFAFKWLVPRLGHFNAQHPHIEVYISTNDNLVKLDQDNADVGIRLGYGNWDDVYQEQILDEHVFPVCSPAFIASNPHIKQPMDLLSVPLLRRQVIDIAPRWRDWFAAAGTHVKNFPKGTRFTATSLALQAAIDHQGVAFARNAYVIDDLNANRLVRLFPQIQMRSNVAFYFVCNKGRENESEIALFKQWLMEEAAVSQRQFETMIKEN